MPTPIVPTRRRRRVTLAGLSGLLVAALGSVAGVLGSLHLRGVVNAALVVLITIAGVVIGLIAQTFTERGALADQARQARRAMALQPAATRQFGLTRTGVLASPLLAADWASYPGHSCDEQLVAAMSKCGTVVVLGAGGTAVAASFAALRRAQPDALLLVPENAESLAELLDVPTTRSVARGQTYVLWLDDLPRFLSGVRLRRYDRLLQTGAVSVVGTAREDAWKQTLERDDDAGAVARGLAARSTIVTVATPGGAAPPGGDGPVVSLEPQGPDGPPARRSRPPEQDEGESSAFSAATLVGLVLMVAVAGFLVFEWRSRGLEVETHRPVAESFAEIRAQENPCGGVGVSPHEPVEGMKDVVAVAHDSDICGTADRVEVYHASAQTLDTKPDLQLALKPRPARSFRCVGPRSVDPCHTDWKLHVPLTLGAFSAPRTDQWLPVVIYRNRARRYAVAALQQPHQPARSTTTLRLAPQAARKLGVSELRGSTVAVVSALAAHAPESATLLLGTRRRGAGDMLDVHAYALSLSGGAGVVPACERAGRRDRSAPVEFPLARGTPPGVAAQAVRGAWLRFVRSGASLRCVQ